MGSQVTAAQLAGSHEPLSCLRMGDNPEIWKAVAMADHFEKIQKLPEPIPGCPNFRRVPGYKVYLCGQPTTEGFEKCLEKVCGSIYPKDGNVTRDAVKEDEAEFVSVCEGKMKDNDGKLKCV